MAVQTLTPDFLASTEQFFEPNVLGGKKTILAGFLPSTERFFFPALAQAGFQPLRVYRAGIYRHRLKLKTLNLSERLGGAQTPSFIEQWPGLNPDEPMPNQEIKITEGGRTEFLGRIDTVKTRIINDNQGNPFYNFEIQARDVSEVFDRRDITQDYASGSSVESVLKDIITVGATGENLTTNGIRTSAILQEALSLKGDILKSAFEKVVQQTGIVYGIDNNRDVFAYLPGEGPNAPWGITATSGNVQAGSMSVTRTSVGKANRVVTRTGVDLG